MLERLILACTLVLSLYYFVQLGTSTPPSVSQSSQPQTAAVVSNFLDL
jgi:hypothetical protein